MALFIALSGSIVRTGGSICSQYSLLSHFLNSLPSELSELLEFPIEYLTAPFFHNMLCLLDTLIRKYHAFDYENKK